MKKFVKRRYALPVFLLLIIILVVPVTANTTHVTVTKLADDNLTVIDQQTVSYQWMRDHLPVLGDGTTHYYHQGPVFIDDPNPVIEEQLRWNPDEDNNYLGKDYGALRGTDVADLCDLVGGMSPGEEVKVQSEDGWNMKFAYANVYSPPARTGPMVVTWETDGMYPDTGYIDGMRLIWFADTSVNPDGLHVFGNYDWHESAAPQYWYYYTSGGEKYPTTTGLSGQVVSDLVIYSNDPVPPPVADFSANIKTNRIVNGNFETNSLSPWNVSNATLYTGINTNYKHGKASVKLVAPASSSASISQSLDFTGISTLNFYRDMFGGTGKYLEVYVDSTLVANFSETTNPLIGTQVIDISSDDFTGTHTLTFSAVNTDTVTTFTIYLDDLEDYGFGISGDAPLIVQFTDLSSKMEDLSHTSWVWDFYNNGTATGTERNPQYTYSANGTYSVKLTATNPGGSDTETKIGYITVGTVAPPDTTAPRRITGLTNNTFLTTSINWIWNDPTDVDFSKVMVYLDGTFKTNVTKGVQLYSATGLNPDTQYTIGTRTVDSTGNVNASWVNHTARTAPLPDTSAPRSVTGLTNNTYLTTSISWTWMDPMDADFDRVMVYLDGTWKQNVTKGVQLYSATGLTADTQYSIGTRTVDTTGNVNASWVNHTARTAPLPDTTAPRSITGLANTTYVMTSINWIWTDPTDADFSKVMVYLDGIWKQNVTKGVQLYSATGLNPDTQYTIGTKTVDTTGNVNAELGQPYGKNRTVTGYDSPAKRHRVSEQYVSHDFDQLDLERSNRRRFQ